MELATHTSTFDPGEHPPSSQHTHTHTHTLSFTSCWLRSCNTLFLALVELYQRNLSHLFIVMWCVPAFLDSKSGNPSLVVLQLPCQPKGVIEKGQQEVGAS